MAARRFGLLPRASRRVVLSAIRGLTVDTRLPLTPDAFTMDTLTMASVASAYVARRAVGHAYPRSPEARATA